MRRASTFAAVLVAAACTGSGGAVAQAPEPRAVAVVVEIARPSGTDPLFGPDAKPAAGAAATIDTIRREVARLAGVDDVAYALKVSPVLCDELLLLDTPPARALLVEIERLSRGRSVLTVPYTDVRFGDVAADELPAELENGGIAVSGCTARDPIGLLAVSDLGVPDEDRLRALRDGPRYVLSGFAFPPPRDDSPWPYAIPAAAAGKGFGPDDALAVRPGAERVAVVVRAATAPAMLSSFAADERIELRPVSSFLDPGVDFREGALYEPEPVSRRFARALRGAREALEDFRSYTLKDNQLAQIFRTLIAGAGSTADLRVRQDATTGRTLGLVQRAIRRQFRLVSLAEGSVTFTSRRGSVPVTVSNEASYPVKVRVSLQSSKLSFRRNERTLVREVAPPGRTITFEALAESSGTFVITGVLKSPRSEVTLDTAEFTVRSTAANLPVLILTIAGALLLVVLYVGRVGRRRREAS